MAVNNSVNPRLKFIYQDSFKNKWYGYVNPLDVDAVRGIAAQRAERHISLMISEDELKLALDAQIQAAKDGDWLKVGAITYDLKHRTQFISEEQSILDLASIYFFLEDENPSELMDSYRLRKQKIWQDDLNCRGFFLRMGISLSEKLRNIPEADLLNFMEKTRETAERIYRHIKTPSER